MNVIEIMREWLKQFPGKIPSNFQIDFTDEIPQNAGLFPTGTMEISRKEDILGNVTVTNQYNFGLYAVFEKPSDADEISTQNAQWIMNLQKWIQEQSIMHAVPTFGNTDTNSETIKAQNGMFYGTKETGTAGLYMVTITAAFKNYYEVI